MATGELVERYTIYIVGAIVLFKLLAALVPEGQTAGDELNASGVPLGSLFTGSGVIWLVLMAGVVILVVRQAMKNK